jgi:hypothetical protein
MTTKTTQARVSGTFDPIFRNRKCAHHPKRKAVAWDYTFEIPICRECKDRYDRMDNDSMDF